MDLVSGHAVASLMPKKESLPELGPEESEWRYPGRKGTSEEGRLYSTGSTQVVDALCLPTQHRPSMSRPTRLMDLDAYRTSGYLYLWGTAHRSIEVCLPPMRVRPRCLHLVLIGNERLIFRIRYAPQTARKEHYPIISHNIPYPTGSWKKPRGRPRPAPQTLLVSIVVK